MTTQAKHTPGPWLENNNRIVQVTEDGNEGHLICYLPPALSGAREENARLIASAPALLEALQAMLSADDAICENIGHKSDQAMQRIAAIDMARAAIQAATLNQ